MIVDNRTASEYRHDRGPPCTARYINSVVVGICRDFKASRILDIGCGNGALCRCLADAGFSVVGMDPSASGIAHARAMTPEGMFHETGLYDAPSDVADSEFDAVVCTEVVEHLFRPAAMPAFAYAKLSAGGILVVSTPYHGFLKNLFISVANHWDAHHGALWDGGHIKFWSRRTLTQLLESSGFEVIAFHGVGRFMWFWKSMVLVARRREERPS